MRAPSPNAYRSAWAGDLRAGRVGEELRVAGWVHRRRDHGGLVFIDLRDRSGLIQLVFHPESSGEAFALAESLRPEHVLTAEGEVLARESPNVNPNTPPGEIEVPVDGAERLATAETPPFPLDEGGDRAQALAAMTELRRRGVSCDTDYAGRSLKGQLTHATRLGARRIVVLGRDGATVRERGREDVRVEPGELLGTLAR